MKTFKGRTAVITGAGSGFGLEAARLAAREGMNVIMADVQQDALDRTADEIKATGVPTLPYRLDVSKAAEVEALGAAVLARLGMPYRSRSARSISSTAARPTTVRSPAGPTTATTTTRACASSIWN